MNSNQIEPEVAVGPRHVHLNWVRGHFQHYEVISIQFKYSSGEHGFFTGSRDHWLNHGNFFVVYHNKYPVGIIAHVHLRVYVVPPRNRHCHFAVSVRHTPGKMARRGCQGPVSDH